MAVWFVHVERTVAEDVMIREVEETLGMLTISNIMAGPHQFPGHPRSPHPPPIAARDSLLSCVGLDENTL